MPRAYPAGLRQQAITLARFGWPVTQVSYELRPHPVTLHKWIRQDDIDHSRRPGTATAESAELKAARQRIHELETELAIIKNAAQFLRPRHGAARRRIHPVIDVLADTGVPHQHVLPRAGRLPTGLLPLQAAPNCAASGSLA